MIKALFRKTLLNQASESTLCIPSEFKNDNFIFIHIPKCAGSSFLNSYLGYQLGHIPISFYAREHSSFYENAFSCAFVREPVQRFISAYNYIHTCSLWPYLPSIADLISSKTASLSELAESIHLYPEINTLLWFKPQYQFVTINNKVAVSRIFKTELYDKSIEWLENNTAVKLISRDQSINMRMARGRTHGLQDISPEGISNLIKFYWRDYTLFGYF